MTVKNGSPVSLRGDPDHPYPRGSLCNKVVGNLDYARSRERVLYPLRSVGAKGSGEFVRISWDEVLKEIAARLGDVIAKDGPEAYSKLCIRVRPPGVALYVSGRSSQSHPA